MKTASREKITVWKAGGDKMPVLEISVVPVGTEETSMSDYVAQACKILDEKQIKYQITPTATVIEGDLKELMEIAERMHLAPFNMGVERVITNITLDDRHDQPMDMEEQVQTVGEKIH
jgi:uncharacterized protein (TIGR00106 family)